MNDNNRFMRALLTAQNEGLFLCISGSDESETVHKVVTACNALGRKSRVIDLKDVPGIYELTALLESNPDKSMITHLTGGDEWLKRTAPHEKNDGTFYDCPFVRHVNTARENIFDAAPRLVWWLKDDSVSAMGTEARDYFNWRTGTYEIDPEAGFGMPPLSGPRLTL